MKLMHELDHTAVFTWSRSNQADLVNALSKSTEFLFFGILLSNDFYSQKMISLKSF